jgi:phosphoribosylformylglycinamidine synthase
MLSIFVATADIAKIARNTHIISQRNVFFIESQDDLSAKELATLRELIGDYTALKNLNSQQVLVTPRFGTISPYASKAGDIFHICGLLNVLRIEKSELLEFDSEVTTLDLSGIFDRMTHELVFDITSAQQIFDTSEPLPLNSIEINELEQTNIELGLALSQDEINYLREGYQQLGRNPTDTELMMFAQANSEHCRHKIFNASWVIDGNKQEKSLFAMIKNTYKQNPQNKLSVYSDNSAVIKGFNSSYFDAFDRVYQTKEQHRGILMKVETHNHPTAIEADAGAATGAGGEIRDEAATGRGSKAKAGLCGFSVSHLKIPENTLPWEVEYGKPEHIMSALHIMLDGPIGAANYNNEFGRPNICGYFRTYEQEFMGTVRGYHKPIMLAGGVGSIDAEYVEKGQIKEEDILIVLGGASQLIGLGGGAASSAHTNNSDLDFASVQRANPEMERRAAEVINTCCNLAQNPIISIHDVGAGGLSNALPELVDDSNQGAIFELRHILNDDSSMSPMQIWCNESQERFVLAINSKDLAIFTQICQRERAPFAVVGKATDNPELILSDNVFNTTPIQMPMDFLLGKTPQITKDVTTLELTNYSFETQNLNLDESVRRVLQLPSVASKKFLITIGDRTVTGLVARDQMIGPKQVPIANCGITLTDYTHYTGEIMAIGERTQLSLVNARASARMAIGEALTNMLGGYIKDIKDIVLSANWMCASSFEGEDAKLYAAVQTVGEELCPELGIAIPVGKDSMSMSMSWQEDDNNKQVVSPLSLIISGFAPTLDTRKQITPLLNNDVHSKLYLIDLGCGKNRLGGSALTQVYNELESNAPDLDNPKQFKTFFKTINELNNLGLIDALHDRSDGGVIVSLLEMAFASEVGLKINTTIITELFNEELGVVVQISAQNEDKFNEILTAHNLSEITKVIATPTNDEKIYLGDLTYDKLALHQLWEKTSFEMTKLRNNPDTATEEYQNLDKNKVIFDLSFDVGENVAASYINNTKPKVAILREQGVNGHIEMASAFDKAGFEAVDVHMSDILSGKNSLADMQGLVACGGFSYGDVLGAGKGWAASILHNSQAFDEFSAFFARDDNFALGVCNGCQMLSQLNTITKANFPAFKHNISGQFEARFSSVLIPKNNSIFLSDMAGSIMPVAIAHGEGRADRTSNNIAMQYVDDLGKPTQEYPFNPNGSENAIAGLSNDDGRITIMMPHPERVVRAVQNSYHPKEWGERSPWMRMFENARKFIG